MSLSQQPPNGLEIKVTVSEAIIVRLIPVVAALLVGSGLVGSGLWVHTQSADSTPDASEVLPKP